jgi:hypothetical protein
MNQIVDGPVSGARIFVGVIPSLFGYYLLMAFKRAAWKLFGSISDD